MRAHKLNNPMIGVLLAISLAAATAAVIWKRQSVTYPVGVKGDRLDIAPRSDCSQVVWPYGCDWQLNASPGTKSHSRFGRRGKRPHGLKRFLS